MKRINSFMLAAVAIFAAASCQKEMANEPLQNEGGDFTITASIGTDTKTVLSDDAVGNKIYWAPGDKISVFNASGAEVAFSTDIAANSTTATFTNDAPFEKPDGKLVAIYPDRNDKESTFDAETGKITNLHIGGTVQAIAETFDSQYAPAVGVTNSDTPNDMAFHNVHCLIKFTIGGTKAPSTVVLKNNGERVICGLYHYNINTGEIEQHGGYTYINVTGPFVVGETYYIPMIPGLCGNGISLEFDGKVVKNTGETKTLLPNKIYNLGTLEAPAAEPVVPLEATLIKAFQSHGTTSYMTAWGGTADKDRNIAIDGNYLYIPETQGNAVMWQISLTDGAATQMPVSNVVTSNVTFALSCPRFLKNTDASVNEGNDVLVVSSMGMNGEETYLYFYKNGLNADPHKVALHNGGNINKRLGDKMSIYGTMQNWAAYYKEQGSSAIINWGGTDNVLNVDNIWPAGRTYMDPTSDTDMGGIYFYSKETAGVKGLITTVANGKYGVLDNMVTHDGKPVYVAQSWGTDPNLKGCHGFNFFNHNEKDYIAYTSFPEKKLYIIEGAANADGVKAALEAKRVVFEAKIAADDNSCGSGHSAADCSVYQKDGNTYVAGHIQNVGVVVYKLN